MSLAVPSHDPNRRPTTANPDGSAWSRPTTAAARQKKPETVRQLDETTKAQVDEYKEKAKKVAQEEDKTYGQKRDFQDKEKHLTYFKSKVTSNQDTSSDQKDPDPTLNDASKVTFGDIHFSDSGQKQKYIKFNPEFHVECLYELMINKWKLSIPQILISIAGGAKDYKVDPETGRQLKKGLVNSASNKNVWVTTGGTDCGVMQFVGRTLAELRMNKKKSDDGAKREEITTNNDDDSSNAAEAGKKKEEDDNAILIGFVPWGIVRDSVAENPMMSGDNSTSSNEKGNDEKKTSSTSSLIGLNPEHTHFVFVDDGKKNGLRAELELRARFEALIWRKGDGLEKEISTGILQDESKQGETSSEEGVTSDQGLMGLVVGLLLEGGIYSLNTVRTLVDYGIPVVVTEGSGRISDVIAFAKHNTFRQDGQSKSDQKSLSSDVEEKLKMQLSYIRGKDDDEEEVLKDLRYLCKSEDKLRTYEIRNPHQLDLSEVLLDMALKTRVGTEDKADKCRMPLLQLTAEWNCFTIAAGIIFNKKRVWKNDGEDDAWKKKIQKMFWHCVRENKYQFISFLLDNGCVKSEQLSEIFFEECFPDQEPLESSLKPAFELIGKGIDLEIDEKKMTEVKRLESDIQKTNKTFFRKFHSFINPPIEKDKREIMHKEKMEKINQDMIVFTCFFLLAVYLRHHETAKVFWERGTNFLANMLLGMTLYKAMADDEPDREVEFLEKARSKTF